MVEPARFTPEELDRIEDALEDLEAWEVVEDPSPQVRDVLESYRGLLVASREALPMEDVPQGALDAVFAEARASASESAPAATPEPEKKPGFFARLRRSFLVPSLALAGTAALVLWMSRPQDSESLIDQPVAANSDDNVEGPLAKEKAPETAEPPKAEPTPAAATPVEADEPEEEVPVDAEPALADEVRAQASATEVPPPEPDQGVAPGTMGKLGEAPEVEQKKADKALPEPDDAAPAWDLIARADRARQDTDCAAARRDYLVATEDDDPKVRARAYAGIGLCNELAGDDASATDAFERARGNDAGIDSFIQSERSPSGTYKPSTKKKRKARKSPPKKKINSADAALDPF